MEKRIIKLINSVRYRLMLQKVINCVQFTIVAGLGLALVVSLISLAVPFYYAPVVEGVVIALSVIVGIVWGIVTSPDRMEAALAADGKGYQERISTALSLISEGNDPKSSEKSGLADSSAVTPKVKTQSSIEKEYKENPYKQLQLQDTLRATQGFSVRKSFPLRASIGKAALGVAVCAVFAASLFADSLVRQRADELHAIKAQAEETVAQIEEVEKALNDSDVLSDSELAEYLEQLENSRSELEDADTYEELLKAQERLEQKLSAVSQETSDTTLAEAAKSAASNTQSLAGSTREDLLAQAQEALDKAQNGTQEEKENAYEKLSELASALGDDNLAQAADNYQSSNYSGQSYAAAKSALAQTASDLSDRALASSSSGTNSSSSDATSSAGSNGNSGDGSNNDGSSGNGNSSEGSNSDGSSGNGNSSDGNSGDSSNGSSENSSDGNSGDGSNGNSGDGSNGSSENSGDGSSSGGSTSGNGNSGSGSSGGNGSGSGSGSGLGWNYGGDTGNEGNASSDESITVPDGEVGDDDNLTGQYTDSDSSSYVQSDQAATWSGNKVSYGSVSAEYKEKAYAQIESSDYPDSLKSQIKSYFEGLN